MNPKGNAHVRANRYPKSRPLSPRERIVMRLLADGTSYKLIAKELGCANKTIHTIVGRLLTRTGLGSRYEVAAWVWAREREKLEARIAELEAQLRTPSLAAAALLEQAVSQLSDQLRRG